MLTFQDEETNSLSFCGVGDEDYPDPLGMGYPFNKKFVAQTPNVPIGTTLSEYSHIKLSRFKIYRYDKLEVDDDEIKKDNLLVSFQNWMNILGLAQKEY